MTAYITSIGQAVPENKVSQSDIATFMCNAMATSQDESRKIKVIYRQTNIDFRYSVLSDYGKNIGKYTFYPNTENLEPFPTISKRMDAYRAFALPLALEAINNCLAVFPKSIYGQITHIITVSCTGMYAPGLDIELVKALGLNSTINRTAINFMGCYGAFNGLKTADAICKSTPNAKVLLVCVELCTLHFQKDFTENHVLANALFGDGAAACLIETEASIEGNSMMVNAFHCDLLPEAEQDMKWDIADYGFEMVLTAQIPKIVKLGIGKVVNDLLEKSFLQKNDINYYAIHPGGKAILESIEAAIGITKADNKYAYDTLRNYGNMSSCTVLFVLNNLKNELTLSDKNKRILSCAFGPGLTLETMILQVI